MFAKSAMLMVMKLLSLVAYRLKTKIAGMGWQNMHGLVMLLNARTVVKFIEVVNIGSVTKIQKIQLCEVKLLMFGLW